MAVKKVVKKTTKKVVKKATEKTAPNYILFHMNKKTDVYIDSIDKNVSDDVVRRTKEVLSDIIEPGMTINNAKAKAIAMILNKNTIAKDRDDVYSHTIAIGRKQSGDLFITYAKPSPIDSMSSNKILRKRGYQICTGRMKQILDPNNSTYVFDVENDIISPIPNAIINELPYVVNRGMRYFKIDDLDTTNVYLYHDGFAIDCIYCRLF